MDGCETLLIADDPVQLDDGFLLFRSEWPALDIRPQIIGPTKSTALPAPEQPCNGIL